MHKVAGSMRILCKSIWRLYVGCSGGLMLYSIMHFM